jgi:peroxiredoxin
VYTAVVTSRAAALWLLLALVPAGAPAAEDSVAALGLMKPNPAQPAKEFRVSTPDNRSIGLSDLKGKVVFLNFWATWCKPCEEEMPSMERLHQQYRERGLVVLAISADTAGPAVVDQFLKKRNLTFPVGLDPKMAVAGLYGVWAVPSTFIIDRKGYRAYYASGPREWDGKAALAFFDSLLREPH